MSASQSSNLLLSVTLFLTVQMLSSTPAPSTSYKNNNKGSEKFKYHISNSWGTNSLDMNVVTTPTSTPHLNRVKFSNVSPSCGFSTEKALNVSLKY